MRDVPTQRIFDPARAKGTVTRTGRSLRPEATMAQTPCPGSQETAQGLLEQGDQDVGFWVEAGLPAVTQGPVTSG